MDAQNSIQAQNSEIAAELLPADMLIVDDQEPVCQLLKKFFTRQGLQVQSTASAIQALKLLDTYEFDVVLTDINMPDFSGLSLLGEIKKRDADTPVIMITASQDIQAAKSAFKLGAYDYLTKPFDQMEILISVCRALEHRKLIKEKREYRNKLESTVSARTRELQHTLMRLEDAYLENRKAHLESIIVLSKVAEVNDKYTGNHIKRVSRYCEELSKAMDMPAKFVEQITYSSAMHDIGKIFVDPGILKKPGQLNSEEFSKIKKHTVKGADILEGVPFLQMAFNIALYHHENYDGTGYPQGLRGEEIPMAARIVSICDVFDAMISKRCYKGAYSLKTAITIIKSEVSRRFDPKIAETFFAIQDHLYQIYLDLKD